MTAPAGGMIREQGVELGLAGYPSHPCRSEAMELMSIANTLDGLNAKLYGDLKEWRSAIEALLADDIVEDLATEAILETLALELRKQWILLVSSLVAGEIRSPSMNHLPLMPVSKSNRFVYERVFSPKQLEGKLLATSPQVPGWQMAASLFGTGMGAIGGVLTVLRSERERYRRSDGGNLQLDMFGGYYETLRLLKLMDGTELSCQGYQRVDTVLERFAEGTTDILFLEMIAYDWIQTVIDPDYLFRSLAERPVDRPWLLVLDTTLLGPTFDIGSLLSACGEKKPLLVLEIRSGLKLDQVGLEFSNVGVIRIFTPDDLDKSRYPDADRFRTLLSDTRKVLGSGLSYMQVAILDAPWIFHQGFTEQLSMAVFDNNRRLALALAASRGIFAEVRHPCLSAQGHLAWAESPFVVIEFRADEDNQENRDLLLAVIAKEVKRRKLVFQMGASFGFRHHRCEFIVPRGPYRRADGSLRGFLKIAMGARYGPTLEGVIELFRELAAYASFEQLREAYAGVDLDAATAVFPDPEALRTIR